jgi:hypothetical protein
VGPNLTARSLGTASRRGSALAAIAAAFAMVPVNATPAGASFHTNTRYYATEVPEGIYDIRPSSVGAQPRPLVVAVEGLSTAIGAPAVLAPTGIPSNPRDPFAEVKSRQWRLQAEPVLQSRTDVYRLVNNHSGKCLDIKGPRNSNATLVHQWNCKPRNAGDSASPANSQLWRLTRNSSGQFQIINVYAANRCLDIPAFQALPNRRLQIWGCGGAWNQAFHVRKLS